MIFFRNLILFYFILSLKISAQQKDNLGQQLSTSKSNIIKIIDEDTILRKIELKNALYDEKNNFPFYLVSKSTEYNQDAIPELIIKSVDLVFEPRASLIKKILLTSITQKFELISKASLCKNENLNHYQLFPFRLNSLNQIEELIDYEINWKILESGQNRLALNNASYTTTSVLGSGDWYKIAITQTGLYKINKTFLNNIGINTTNLDPRKIRIYGNGGKMLPEKNSEFREDDLVENAIQINGEQDGTFDNLDYILFYATATNTWLKTNSVNGLKFKSIKNFYSDTSFYYITLNSDISTRKRVVTKPSSVLPSSIISNSYDYYNSHELDLVNLAKSGRYWYGECFDFTTAYSFSWNEGDFVSNDTLISEVVIAGLNSDSSQFLINGNGFNYKLTTAPININYYLSDHAAQSIKSASVLNTKSSSIEITLSKLTTKSIGWLDKLTINARRKLKLNSKQFQFRDTRICGANKVCEFNITNSLSSEMLIWDVTMPLEPINQSYNANGVEVNFRAESETLKEYCIVPIADLYTPGFVGKIENQNLHGILQADYIIISNPMFLSEAKRLALLHQKNENLSYAIASIDEIYNEFSSGKQDISAIRDFIRMIYSRNNVLENKVKYVLLMGDGSYNNKTRSLLNNSNLIPTYQSINSLSAISSIATDDFFGLMDATEGENAENYGAIDIGIGRFTCRTLNEIKAVVNKIENYYKKDEKFQINNTMPQNCSNSDESPMGDWRNNLLFLADDGDGALHMRTSDKLANQVKQNSRVYNLNQINLDAYQRISTPGGKRYPDAAIDFTNRIKKGVLIFNYTGHGGEVGLSEERVIDIPTIEKLDNFNKLPLFITATCEFSRYDDPARTSAGELCLLNSNGGAIALLTTCRVAYSSTNENLNILVLDKAFKKLANGKMPALGDILQQTKSALLQSSAYANFHLLGDPAMRLAYPNFRVTTTKINNKLLNFKSKDTLAALAKVTISGQISDDLGNKLTNFNGILYSTIFDKEQDVICLLNDENSYNSVDPIVGSPFKFKLQKNSLYRGKAQVTGGDFSFSFLVPKDISYSIGPGRISYYAKDAIIDANGYYDNLVVGGGAKNITLDLEGPKINLFLNDQTFINGGVTNERPILYVDLIDSSGINALGVGIGHDISVILDQKSTSPLILNDYYEANLNTYQSGRVRFPFSELSEGPHQLSFKVWDIQNNSNSINSDFIVAKSAELALKHVLNYPNPFTTNTKFMFEHNQACNPLKVTVQIFTISGKLVKTIQKYVYCEGFNPEGVDWDGKDDFGDRLGRGVYIYQLSIVNAENKKAEKIEKLVILN